ncbi:DUF481 domain-containing protein [Vulgatibacter sp.]|uniref:DUF481 domain-containing protein n=1 Tax=Vulgatibacter sp. TaxID=1971226 RepID=UPI003564DD53
MRILSPALCVAAALALPGQAAAFQGSSFQLAQAGTPEEIEERARSQRASTGKTAPGTDEPVALSAELATALSRGNTESFLASGSLRLVWVFADRWVSETRGTALYQEDDEGAIANKWGLFERVDRFLSDRLSAFAAAGIERDVFAALDYRYSGQLGASYLLVENRDPAKDDLLLDKLTFELGAYAAREDFVLPPNAEPGTVLEEESRDIVAGRAALAYEHSFRRGTNVGVQIEVIQDFVDTENFVFNDTAYIAAGIVEGLALKVAFTHRYDAQPASEELEENDLLLTAGIVVSI